MTAIKYDPAHVSQAKRDGLCLVTLDITGTHAKRPGAIYQGCLLTQDEIEEAWRFFEWLALKRHDSRTAAAREATDANL